MLRENRLRRGIRLFDHPLLDWASRVHPLLPALFWGPISLAALILGFYLGVRGWHALALFIAGYAAWIVAEYGIHRWFFHFNPKAIWLKRLFYYVHEHHHRYQEWDRLLAPPLISISIASAIVGTLYLTIGRSMGLAAMFVLASGVGLGYLIYDYTHLYIHFARPKSRWGKFLRRCHFEHHFARPDRWFCISFPLLDYLFGTYGRRGDTMVGAPMEHDEEREALPKKVREFEAARQTATPDLHG